MTTDPGTLVDAAKCLGSIPGDLQQAARIYLLCASASIATANPAAPCQFTITLTIPGPYFTLTWVNPVAYDNIQVWKHPVSGSPVLADTIAGNATTWGPQLAASTMEFYSVRGVKSGNYSAFAHTGACV